MKGGTLFSGIGAPECAAPFIDWRWSADIDEFANAVRAHHWPDVPSLGDVGGIDAEAVERPDVIVFGSPCQSFSVAGKRLGLGDPRGDLALTALALVRELRPRWFVFENVPGLRSNFSGSEQAAGEVRSGLIGGWAEADEDRDFATFLTRVLECGYTGAWASLDARHFNVAQRRERVFFVGHLGDDWRPSAAVLFEPESLSGHPAPGREAGQDIAASVAASAGHHGYSSPRGDGSDNLIASHWDGDYPHPTLNQSAAGSGGVGASNQEIFSQRGAYLVPSTGPLSHCLNAGGMGRQDFETETLVAFSCKDHGADAGGTSPTLRAMGHDGSHPNAGGQVAVAFAQNQRGELRTMDVAAQLTTGGGKPGEGYPAAMVGPMVRRLTPTECERLQGFPDGFTDIPWRGKPAPDGRRYKALGNSMAVPVLRWLLERLWIVDQETAALAAPKHGGLPPSAAHARPAHGRLTTGRAFGSGTLSRGEA